MKTVDEVYEVMNSNHKLYDYLWDYYWTEWWMKEEIIDKRNVSDIPESMIEYLIDKNLLEKV